MSAAAKLAEVDVAARAVAALREAHWEVHEEVVVGGGCADIIAVMRHIPGRKIPFIRHIEVKTALTVDLVEQALTAKARFHSHTVEVAVPRPRRSSSHTLETMLRREGIGLLWVHMEDGWRSETPLEERIAPRLLRPPLAGDGSAAMRRRMWLAQLRRMAEKLDAHLNLVPAGTPGSKGRWTPYRGTVHRIRNLIEERGEVTLGEVMEAVEHHYATPNGARASIPRVLYSYETEWCVSEHRDGCWRFRLKGTDPGFRLPPDTRVEVNDGVAE